MSRSNIKIFIVAGEASGDNIGAKLIHALKKRLPNLELLGVGGKKMQEQGLKSIFPIQELSIMGFVEIVPKLYGVLKRLDQTLAEIEQFAPDFVITIDSYGFNSRLVKKVRAKFGKSIKIFHYVSPTVWAYKPHRANIISQLYDHIFVLLPFEKQYYDKLAFPATFVGHPIVEDYRDVTSNQKAAIRKKLQIKADEVLCVMMPGSRIGEIARLKGVFLETIKEIQKKSKYPVRFYIPVVGHLKETVRKAFPLKEIIISDDLDMKQQMLSIADVAFIKSGTSSVEMMVHNIPHVVAYKISWLSYWYIKSQIKVKFVSLVNIIKNKQVVPEFIQASCNSEFISKALLKLINDPVERKKQIKEFKDVLKIFGLQKSEMPSEKVAKVILAQIKR